jgi:hypothetical protein
MIIPLGPPLPAGSSNLPESLDGPPSNALLFGLAPGGVCLASDVTTGTGELLPHRFTLTPPTRGGLLSVALSCSSPRLGVTQHPALRSPDFPPVPLMGTSDHLTCSKWFVEIRCIINNITESFRLSFPHAFGVNPASCRFLGPRQEPAGVTFFLAFGRGSRENYSPHPATGCT